MTTLPQTPPLSAASHSSPNIRTGGAGRTRRLEGTAAWGTLAVMLLATLFFVARLGSATFFGDDWDLAPVLAGDQPVTPGWLWEQHNEHRIALPRLVVVTLYRATANSLRAPMFFDVLLLGAAAAVLIRAARAIRGRTSATDAFFPLVLLHWGHAENLLWDFQVAFILPTVLLLVVLAAVVRGPDLRGRTRDGLVAGACLLMIAVCGAVGVIWPPVLAAWAPLAALPLLRSSEGAERRTGAALLVLPAAAVAAVGLYFVGYHQPPGTPRPPGPGAFVRTSLQTLGMMFGASPYRIWPAAVFGAVAVVVLAAVPPLRVLGRAAREGTAGGGRDRAVLQNPELPRAAGLLLCLAAVALLALSIGWGRAGLGPTAGMATRYVTLTTPALCVLYFAWLLYGAERSRRAALVCLAGAAVALPINQWLGLRWGRRRREQVVQFERDLRAGLPASTLAQRHWAVLGIGPGAEPGSSGSQYVARNLDAMRRAGVGQFRSPDPRPPLPAGPPARP